MTVHSFTPERPEHEWPEPNLELLGDGCPPAPPLPLLETFGPKWTEWITAAAEAKSAPVDYIVGGLLAVAGSLIGNSRCAVPWPGWTEPPIFWTMLIGSPSSNKSPALDALLSPLRELEAVLRAEAANELADWRERQELAKIADATWREQVRAAMKDGGETPERPEAAKPGPEPVLTRLAVTDSTVERLAVILAGQPRGTLLARDELAGWLQGMTRYANGGSDKPFWLEAYGARSYTVERMGRDPVHVDRLAIGVTGSIQPDRLSSLLLQADDDGLVARFLPIWPNLAPLRRPRITPDDGFLTMALGKLYSLRPVIDEHDRQRPWLVPFSETARSQLDDFRLQCRELEGQADGMLLSFIGKQPGFSVRLALVLALLEWAASGPQEQPHEIGANTYARAVRFCQDYAQPMARRAYAEASVSKNQVAASRLLSIIRGKAWSEFASRDVLVLKAKGLSSAQQLDRALNLLESARAVRRKINESAKGRPSKRYLVNPRAS